MRADHRAKECDVVSAQGPSTHAGSSIFQEIEEVAAEVYHEAEHMLHEVGETVSAYFSRSIVRTSASALTSFFLFQTCRWWWW